MTGSVVFRLRPDSKSSLENFEHAIESVKCMETNLFTIKSYKEKLIVKINDMYGENKNLTVNLSNNKTVKLDSIIDFNPGHTGTHSVNNGVFIFKGPLVKKGIRIKDITPYDITPTILALFNQPIPLDVDGRILKEVFKDEIGFI
jgi:predicted AlkP superfamily phosphohydrolase/phosphomutase